MEFIKLYQGYFYLFGTILLVLMMYGYIWYLYTGKKRGVDYEKYSNLALNDELDDTLVDASYRPEEDNEKNAKKNKE